MLQCMVYSLGCPCCVEECIRNTTASKITPRKKGKGEKSEGGAGPFNTNTVLSKLNLFN